MSSWVSFTVCFRNRKKKKMSLPVSAKWQRVTELMEVCHLEHILRLGGKKHHCIIIHIIAWLLSFSFSLKNKAETNSSCSNEPITTWNSYFITHITATSLTISQTQHSGSSLLFQSSELGLCWWEFGGAWVREVDAGMLWTWTLCSDRMFFVFFVLPIVTRISWTNEMQTQSAVRIRSISSLCLAHQERAAFKSCVGCQLYNL